MNKRITSLLLTAIMLFPLAPAQAFAAGLCTHHPEHNDACGYEATQRCTFVCESCNLKEDHFIGTEDIAITAFDGLDEAVQNQSVPAGTALEDLNLPATLGASGYTVMADTAALSDAAGDSGEATTFTIEDVTWGLENEINNGSNTYNPDGGSYCFIPILPDGYIVINGVSLPEITVRVGAANTVLDLQGNVLTVEFNDSGSGGTSSSDSEMKTTIGTALASGDKTTVTTIKLTGSAAEITSYNWNYLIDQYMDANGWSSLTDLDLSGMTHLKTINAIASWNKRNKLHTLTLPESVTEIGGSTFSGCKSLVLEELPAGLNQIGKSAFTGCTSLALEELPAGLNQIGMSAFRNCTNLALEALPSKLTEIGEGAFSGCTSLANIIIEPTFAPTLGANVFSGTSSSLTFYVPKDGQRYDSDNWKNLQMTAYTPTAGLTLNTDNLSLYTNASPNTRILTAKLEPADATYTEIRWISSDTSVATVDPAGNVTAKADGTATITAASQQGGKTDTCTVTVSREAWTQR